MVRHKSQVIDHIYTTDRERSVLLYHWYIYVTGLFYVMGLFMCGFTYIQHDIIGGK